MRISIPLLKQLMIIGFVATTFSLISQTPFSDVTIAAGIVSPTNNTVANKHTGDDYFTGMNLGTGAVWFDYDKDGHLDLYYSNRETANFMYHNEGDGTFTEVAASLGLDDPTGDGSGVSVADYNNDGWNDLYLCNGYADKLFRNDNGTGFTDVTSDAGFDVNSEQRSTSASWGDFDNDGYLDLYVGRHRPIYDADPSATSQDQLWRNNGDGTFTDVSSHFVTSNLKGAAFIAAWFDFDQDSDLDILVINDCPLGDSPEPTLLFRNDGGTDGETDWTFTECAVSVGIDDCRNGMGIAIGDYNRDGWMDIYYSNIGPAVFFENDNGTFTDVTASLGVEGTETDKYSWGTCFFDHNNNGWQDLFLVSGFLKDSSETTAPSPNYFFENNGDDTYSDISTAIGMDDESRGRSGTYGDYDNDGDLDIFLLNYDQKVNLRKNNNDNGYHWIKINLVGTESNKNGIGSKIKLTTPDNVVQYFETRSGSNLGGGDALYAHFGLKDNTSITEIEVTWPSGTIQTETDVSVDQVLEMTEPEPPLPIGLTNFTARLVNNEVQLDWQTAQEINNDYFIIQRSSDGVNFQNLNRVDGNGTSNQIVSYKFIDTEPNHGINYYRLKQVDFNGAASISPLRYVNIEHTGDGVLIKPNPVVHGILDINTGTRQSGTIEIFNVFRSSVLFQQFESNAFELSLQDLSSGIYFIVIRSGNFTETQKIVVARE